MALTPTALAADFEPAVPDAKVCYPTAIVRNDDGTELKKIYDLSPEDDPAGIARSDFEKDGYYRLPYQEAVLLLLGRKNNKSFEQAKPAKEAPKPFALPEPYGTMRRMYAYLMRQRHIDREVISAFVHEKLLYEDRHHNCVFVGLDDSGEAKHAHIRSTNSEGRVFRMNIEGSASEHCFHKNGTDKSLYVFEAPIDLLSHITLYPYGWQEHSYVACCGTSIQPVLERLRQNPKLDMVYLCLDNDDAGNDACDRMTDTLEDMGLDVERLCPVRKDWNDDLCAKFERKEKDT